MPKKEIVPEKFLPALKLVFDQYPNYVSVDDMPVSKDNYDGLVEFLERLANL